MTRPNCSLLTVDEAKELVGRAAIILADLLSDRPDRLASLITDRGSLRGLRLEIRTAAYAWRSAVAHVNAVGLGWVLNDEIEGALSYVGIDIELATSRAA